MHGDMIGRIALDLILRFVLIRVVRIAFVIRVLRMNLDNPTSDMPSLGIPSDVIADLETFSHLLLHAACLRIGHCEKLASESMICCHVSSAGQPRGWFLTHEERFQ